MPIPQASAAKVLLKEFKKLEQEPLEGFCIVSVDDADIYEWTVAIFGPPGTIYEGGYFKSNVKISR
jgi:ubiquitin-conjugating enzyme E2 R